MNEPDEGKDETDSSFITAKSTVRQKVKYGANAETAMDFINVLKSGGGIAGMLAKEVDIIRPMVVMAIVNALENVKRYSHIKLIDEGMWCWEQQYGIGPGRFYSNDALDKPTPKDPLLDCTGVKVRDRDEICEIEAKLRLGKRGSEEIKPDIAGCI
ncbi:hypothetical protein CYMTET_52563 [Cymbomonas tetramitiformis]|uniref:Uncharacterized protein n=1 Tax=Cymbomonas tetramitiformis TaxID=36881 RepID=A0AAE0BIS2_9CHLO|nr:hypothetical protein CYMTET_52563 [Cymbomonas tetramitiformis]